MFKKRHSAEFKAKVALEAIRGIKPLHSLASELGVHPVQIARWKKQAQDLLVLGFRERRQRDELENERLKEELYEQIGRMKVELDWLKKKSGLLD